MLINILEKEMQFKIMRLICMFDLPVETAEDKRIYREFRKILIKEGFTMMQYSVYVRTCPSRDFAKGIEKRLKENVPKDGNVRLLTVTEKQYDDMVMLVGSKSLTEEVVNEKRMLIL